MMVLNTNIMPYVQEKVKALQVKAQNGWKTPPWKIFGGLIGITVVGFAAVKGWQAYSAWSREQDTWYLP